MCQYRRHFNPLPSHEGRLSSRGRGAKATAISIHSPHTRGDQDRYDPIDMPRHFNPLSSHEGRLNLNVADTIRVFISIHSPHTRGDGRTGSRTAGPDISIHSPHTRGDRHDGQSGKAESISIHSPHTRGDSAACAARVPASNFNPLPSHEGRPWQRSFTPISTQFQSTPLTRGETCKR